MTTPAQIFTVARTLLLSFTKAHKDELQGSEGGWFNVLPIGAIASLKQQEVIGNLAPGTGTTVSAISNEAIFRLQKNHELSSDHVSSFQSTTSADPELGAAIKGENYYISIGGFPAKLGYKFLLQIALEVKELNQTKAGIIREILAIRSLAHDITLEEAIEVLKLGEGYEKEQKYQLRRKRSPQEIDFSQLYYVYTPYGQNQPEEQICVNFSDEKNSVSLCRGNQYFRTHYRITKYLEKQGFNLAEFTKNG